MGIIKGDDLVNMTADELATKERRSEIEKYKKEQKDKIITGISPEDLGTLFLHIHNIYIYIYQIEESDVMLQYVTERMHMIYLA